MAQSRFITNVADTIAAGRDTLAEHIEKLKSVRDRTNEFVEAAQGYFATTVRQSIVQLSQWEVSQTGVHRFLNFFTSKEPSVVSKIAETQERLVKSFVALNALSLPGDNQIQLDDKQYQVLCKALKAVDDSFEYLLQQIVGAEEYIKKDNNNEGVTRRAFLVAQTEKAQQVFLDNKPLYEKVKCAKQVYEDRKDAEIAAVKHRGALARQRRGYGTMTSAVPPVVTLSHDKKVSMVPERRIGEEQPLILKPLGKCAQFRAQFCALFHCTREVTEQSKPRDEPRRRHWGRIASRYEEI